MNKAKKIKNAVLRPKIRKGDTVRVLSGKDRSKKGSVMAVINSEGRVLVEGLNMVMKHTKPKRSGEKGQRVSVAAPMALSNVQLVCPSCKKGSRIGIVRDGDIKQRKCKKCEEIID